MKKVCLHLPKSPCIVAIAAWVFCSLLSLSVTQASAQANASVAPMPPISTEDLEQAPDWKSPLDYAAVLASERVNAAQQIASPTTKETGFALYTAYDRMLAYMEADLQASQPIDEIANKNYKRVSDEAVSDPALTNLETPSFDALYVNLLVLLHQ